MTHLVSFPGLGLSFTVNEVAFSIGDYQIRWYGIIIALGFLLALIYVARSVKKMNIPSNPMFDAVLVGFIGSVICARLYYVVFSGDPKYFENPIEILKIHEGGMAIYGGIIGALLFGGLMAKIRKLKVAAVLDITSLGFLIGQCVGRWGNFVNQEAFGSATNLPWAMLSDNTEAVTGGSVHPCFLYESILCLIGFILLHFFTRKLRRYDGQTFLLYIVWYGASRFFIEGLRTDSLYFMDFRVSQIVAAACVVVGLILLFAFRHKTSLTGCGSRKVMEAVGLAQPEVDPNMAKSTIFGNFIPEEYEDIYAEKAEAEEDTPEDETSPEEATDTPETSEDSEKEGEDGEEGQEKATDTESTEEKDTEEAPKE